MTKGFWILVQRYIPCSSMDLTKIEELFPHKVCKRCFAKIWHLLNTVWVIDGGSFIKCIVFFNDQWRLPEPVLSDDGNLLWHVLVMICDSLQPAILNCGIFLLEVYLEYYK